MAQQESITTNIRDSISQRGGWKWQNISVNSINQCYRSLRQETLHVWLSIKILHWWGASKFIHLIPNHYIGLITFFILFRVDHVIWWYHTWKKTPPHPLWKADRLADSLPNPKSCMLPFWLNVYRTAVWIAIDTLTQSSRVVATLPLVIKYTKRCMCLPRIWSEGLWHFKPQCLSPYWWKCLWHWYLKVETNHNKK